MRSHLIGVGQSYFCRMLFSWIVLIISVVIKMTCGFLLVVVLDFKTYNQ